MPPPGTGAGRLLPGAVGNGSGTAAAGTAALKDQPAIPFRIPPGIELVRVNVETGQLAKAGDKQVIYEAFKPGSEPSGDGPVTVVTGGLSDGEDDASMAGSGGLGEETTAIETPSAAVPAAVPLPSTTAPGSSRPVTAPGGGTGGLY